jgi:hypothetical protein
MHARETTYVNNKENSLPTTQKKGWFSILERSRSVLSLDLHQAKHQNQITTNPLMFFVEITVEYAKHRQGVIFPDFKRPEI